MTDDPKYYPSEEKDYDKELTPAENVIANFWDDVQTLSPEELKVSDHLRGPQRLEGENYHTYRSRRKGENKIVKMYLKGYYI